MADLEQRLAQLRDSPPASPTPLLQIVERARLLHRRRLVRRGVIVVAAMLLLGVAGAGLTGGNEAVAPVGDHRTQGTVPYDDTQLGEGYASPYQREHASDWLTEYDPTEVALIETQANGGVPDTGLVSVLEYRRACRSTAAALDLARAQPGNSAAIDGIMNPAIALLRERSQPPTFADEFFGGFATQLKAGHFDQVSREVVDGSCSGVGLPSN